MKKTDCDNIILYHYSEELYPIILSRSGQHINKRKGVKGVGNNYNDSVSFFLSPIPRNIASLLGNAHHFWHKSKSLFEYEIPLSNIPNDVEFELVESKERTALVKTQDWEGVGDDPVARKQYIDALDDLETRLGYVGNTSKQLKSACCKYSGVNLTPYYRALYKEHRKHPSDGLMTKYAPNIPHLMIYVGSKPIKYSAVKEIRIF